MKSAAACCLAGFCVVGTAARADDDYLSPTADRVRLSVGVMRLGSATDIRVDNSEGVPGTTLSAEHDLGLDSSDIEPKVGVMVRAGENNRIRFDYFTLDRSATKTLALGPTGYGSVVLFTGDPVQSDLTMRLVGITYGYSFWHSEPLEFAATLGVNATDISSQVRVNTATRHVFASENLAGPVPTPGLDATWVVNKHFYLDGRAQYLRVAVDHFEGSLSIYELNALYRFHPNISVALGYMEVRTDLTSRQTRDAGYFRFDSKGPQIFLRVAF
jgi:hypothetical protein